MNEYRLQFELNMWFSQTYPDYQDRFFMVQNTTYSQSHGNKLKAMGLKKSVSDMLYLGELVGCIELKAVGTKHAKEHVKQQLEWGKSQINAGNYFLMTNNITDAKLFLSLLIEKNKEQLHRFQQFRLESLEERLNISGSVVMF